jgi:hypothetical protein
MSAENQYYEGHFRCNKRHGEGKLLKADGVTILAQGRWKNDLRDF